VDFEIAINGFFEEPAAEAQPLISLGN